MKDRFKLFSMALCACAFAACNDNEGVDGPGDGDKSPVQYVVMSATSDGTANYLQLASDPTKGTIDPTDIFRCKQPRFCQLQQRTADWHELSLTGRYRWLLLCLEAH